MTDPKVTAFLQQILEKIDRAERPFMGTCTDPEKEARLEFLADDASQLLKLNSISSYSIENEPDRRNAHLTIRFPSINYFLESTHADIFLRDMFVNADSFLFRKSEEQNEIALAFVLTDYWINEYPDAVIAENANC